MRSFFSYNCSFECFIKLHIWNKRLIFPSIFIIMLQNVQCSKTSKYAKGGQSDFQLLSWWHLVLFRCYQQLTKKNPELSDTGTTFWTTTRFDLCCLVFFIPLRWIAIHFPDKNCIFLLQFPSGIIWMMILFLLDY